MNDKRVFFQNLPRKQIEDSPAIETPKLGSRQYLAVSERCFGWPCYWGGQRLGEGMVAPHVVSTFRPQAGAAINQASQLEDADMADLYFARH